jgi:hypothetical protein
MLEAAKLGERFRAADAVNGKPDVALELPQSSGGVVAEYPVDPSGVETQCPEALLKLGDVVTAEHRNLARKHPVPEAIVGFDQRRPGLRAADAVNGKAATPLETPDRLGRVLVVGAADARVETQTMKPPLKVGYRWATSADLKQHYR